MIHLDGNSLTLEQLAAIASDFTPVGLTEAARARVREARAVVDRYADSDAPAYGINTGFGSFAEVRIPHGSLSELQVNLLRSHAAGVGEPLPVPAVRAAMALRANVLAKGFSGIRLETLDLLIELLNRRVHPHVPSRGSVGASGDLAPLAHIALVLIGEGEVADMDATEGGAAALTRVGLTPLTLAPKEGLALINGTQPSTALLALAVKDAECLARAADITAALSIDGLQGSSKPFEARIHAASTCAARRRCTARRARRSPSRAASPSARPMPPPTTRWSSPTAARSSPAATFTARRSRWRPICCASRWRSWRRSASGVRIASSTRP